MEPVEARGPDDVSPLLWLAGLYFVASIGASFVRFFDNFKPGVAERILGLQGPPFRADRLPFVRRAREGGDGTP